MPPEVDAIRETYGRQAISISPKSLNHMRLFGSSVQSIIGATEMRRSNMLIHNAFC